MPVSDPIADLCTRIRNATMRQHKTVEAPYSQIKANILRVLKDEGFIEDWKKEETESFPILKITLKYDKSQNSVIRKINRVSKPGLRIYSGVDDLKTILNGQGISVITTSHGIFSDRECRKNNVGGEVICQVW
ncbi:MAG: 30S ribosomal protein S8 [SAR324 cluster bacterium]|nr:30S ribosomal protein S8 [SAR324 cluster bacterium]